MINAGILLNYARKALGCGYVLGAQGEMYTPQLAAKWAKQKRAGQDAAYFLERCKVWFGHTVYDCSGLIVAAARTIDKAFADRRANDFRNQATHVYSINAIPNTPGLFVWRPGHIGIYMGNGLVIEAGGVSAGVVETKINKPATGKAWQAAFAHKDFEYTTITATKPGQPGRYVVQSGDTLSDIAKRFKVDMDRLYAANRATIGPHPSLIKPGMVLNLDAGNTYTVQKGDTLTGIAKRLKIDSGTLYRSNIGVIGKDPSLIKPGMVLKIG